MTRQILLYKHRCIYRAPIGSTGRVFVFFWFLFSPLLLVIHGGILTSLGDFVPGMCCKEKLVLKLLHGETENSHSAQI